MLVVDKPGSVNGQQLSTELSAMGLPSTVPTIDGELLTFPELNESHRAQVVDVIAAHEPLPFVRPLSPGESEVRLAARLGVVDKVRAEALDDGTLAQLAGLFPAWDVGIDVKAGEVYAWDGTLVEVIQPHATQADWTPDLVPALFKIHRKAGRVTAWVQPTGAHDAYDAGAVVTHNGQTWDNTHGDGNSWEPGVFGWTAR